MKIHRKSDGQSIHLKLNKDGRCYCPVCGKLNPDKRWQPYDEFGFPSIQACPFCRFTFGFDDAGWEPVEKQWANWKRKM